MSKMEANMFKSTIDENWTFEFDGDNDGDGAPVALARTFAHADYLQAARFAQKVAAVAETAAHFPSILLDRHIVRKMWRVTTRVRCQTKVLAGLSANDFHLAMLMDVEADRPETKSLLLDLGDA